MYETMNKAYQPNQLSAASQQTSQCAVEYTPSVAFRTDRVLEQANVLRFKLAALLDQLKQIPPCKDCDSVPCRSGLDGKLADASDRLDTADLLLEELTRYLVA